MSEPMFDQTTQNVYDRLPEHFRRNDKDFQLKKYLSGICSIQDQVNSLASRFEYHSLDDEGVVGDTSDLVNPHTADLEWLPWLAQLLGVNLRTSVVDESTRNEVVNASNGYLAGTDAAIISAVQSELVGSKSVKLTKRQTSSGSGGVWDLLISTLQSETLFNILPSNIIVPSSPNNYIVDSVPTGDIDRVSFWIVKDPKFYKSRTLEFKAVPVGSGIGGEPGDTDDGFGEDDFGEEEFGTGDGVGTPGPDEYIFYTPFYFPLDGTDPLTTMVDISYESGTNDHLVVSAGIDLYEYSGGTYTALDEIVGVEDQTLNVGHMDRFLGRSEGISADATHGRFLIRLENVGDNAIVHFGHFGARKETNTEWVPRTADPIGAVIDRGAKPAGIKLWHTFTASSWADLENGGTTTWADLEGLDWVSVEEFDG